MSAEIPADRPKNPRPAVETHEGPVAVREEDRPPIREVGAGEWVRDNLFSGPRDTLLTVVVGLLIAYVAFRAFRFVFFTGRWTIIQVNLLSFVIGRFPRDEMWRPIVTSFAMAALVPLWLGKATRTLQEAAVGEAPGRDWRMTWSRAWPFLALLAAILAFTTTITPALLVAGGAVLGVLAYQAGRRVPARYGRAVDVGVLVGVVAAFYLPLFTGGLGWSNWGGLLMTLFAAAVGIGVSFPIGIALALGRRSKLPGVRLLSIGYIELIRGVPLITLLLMAFFVVGFVLPPGSKNFSIVGRGLIAIVAFTAAYVAEIVRGGLQSVPKGQVEAAQAVGLSPWKVTRLVVLPQALRNVIPALVGQFISLFKDTSLLAIIGILELLRVAQVVTDQPRFNGQGLLPETLTFAAFTYWVFAYAMSRESQRLERRLGLGER
jgi:general L-amino acid transport system permease protein